MTDNSNNWLVSGLLKFTDFLLWTANQLADPAVRASIANDLGIIPQQGNKAIDPDLDVHFDNLAKLRTETIDTGVLQSAVEEMRSILQALRDLYEATQGDTTENLDAGFDAAFR